MFTDDKTRFSARKILEESSQIRGFKRFIPFLGPTFIAAISYIDPGNFATNIEGGSKYGYTLLWVIFYSNVIAAFIQYLSSKLGIATGYNLPELIRDKYKNKPFIRYFYWVQAELVAIATDLAEFLGGAVGFHLIFGVSLFEGAILTGVCTILILEVEKYGFRPMEIVVAIFLGLIFILLLAEMIWIQPDLGQIGKNILVPRIPNMEAFYLSAGIIGATVMPHVIYLHSSLTQKRIVLNNPSLRKKLIRWNIIDVILAMSIAGVVNMALLIIAAKAFHGNGYVVVAIEKATPLLEPLFGRLAALFLGLALIFSGISSSVVGTLSGQVIMQGFTRLNIPIWVRRGVTMVPAFVVILMQLDTTATMVLSQVMLSFGIPIAMIPLLNFTSNPQLMKELTNRKITHVIGWIVTLIIIIVNIFLIFQLLNLIK